MVLPGCLYDLAEEVGGQSTLLLVNSSGCLALDKEASTWAGSDKRPMEMRDIGRETSLCYTVLIFSKSKLTHVKNDKQPQLYSCCIHVMPHVILCWNLLSFV